jgi:diketogulonate reductase-like aldo/keto reductase
MVERTIKVQGATVPNFMYGTAWKEDETERLVLAAVGAGFRAIDTANQRRHYNEAGVGRALAALFGRGAIRRDELFLQTKFTYAAGQDHRLPYDPRAPIKEQVRQSFESSLVHLGVESLDSYVLHGPSRRHGLGPADHEAWREMEELHAEGRTKVIGVSNVAPDQLEALLAFAKVKPAFVQNRCFAELHWDAEVREICDGNGIVYQGFSLLTANGRSLARPEVDAIARRHQKTVPQVVFRFARELGMLPLTGTTDEQHMVEDLASFDFDLDEKEVHTLLHAH